MTTCTYVMDATLRLVDCDDAWNAFAADNQAPELVRPGPLGRSLFDFIGDVTTAQLYRELFDRVRLKWRPVSFPFRCDSPTRRRFMNLTISPMEGGFQLVSTIVRTEERTFQSLLAGGGGGADGPARSMCSWCKRVRVNGLWLDVEHAVAAMRLFERDRPPQISHGACEDCYRAITDALGD